MEAPDRSVYKIPPYPQDSRATRVYSGPVRKWDSRKAPIGPIYGPRHDDIELFEEIRARYQGCRCPVAAPFGDSGDGGDSHGEVLDSPWLPDGLEKDQQAALLEWFVRDENVLPRPDGHPDVDKTHPEHFIFHPGGKVLSLAWAPLADASSSIPSLLAVAVVPHDNPASGDKLSEEMMGAEGTKENERVASIQFWWLPLYRGKGPSPNGFDHLPKMFRLSCFSWGWPKRMEWCPVKPNDPTMLSFLALLTEDGIVRVIKVKKSHVHKTTYDEPTIQATCMSWVGVNRIAVGYSDGSIALWSVRPQMVVVRLPAHAAAVQDICSAYPSMPYLVASRPVEGFLRLIDLRRPSSEHTFHPSPVASIKGDLLGWSEHMQGFASATPFNSPLNNSLDFLHYRHFPLPRKFFASSRESPPTYLAIGKVHPFALVGTSDGKVWMANLPDIVFPSHDSMWNAQLVLSSEFRPPPAPVAVPAAGWGQDSTLLGGVMYSTWANSAEHSAGRVRGKAAASRPVSDNSDDEGEPEASEGSLGIVIHEGPTAVTSVAWHPNHDYGTWAAIGFASGLVLVKNLGLH
ncbi:hypothetical protein SCUCBS95973_009522 [Sporothrix curviconia]|uniref:Anaphase-promoting complex subunit 4-like WD40 domain-containing protein n=1 Tax=Sporothrix curviconia TaxID=1260050 RepID=A0ABP0CVL4_9PEZI